MLVFQRALGPDLLKIAKACLRMICQKYPIHTPRRIFFMVDGVSLPLHGRYSPGNGLVALNHHTAISGSLLGARIDYLSITTSLRESQVNCGDLHQTPSYRIWHFDSILH